MRQNKRERRKEARQLKKKERFENPIKAGASPHSNVGMRITPTGINRVTGNPNPPIIGRRLNRAAGVIGGKPKAPLAFLGELLSDKRERDIPRVRAAKG